MAKICDFGWSVHCPREFRTTLCGTPLYLSPEILSGKQYNKKIDTWAIGALTHELYTGENPFKIKNKDDLSKIITEDFEMEHGSP
jgi:serine/threonine protein kinase